MNIVLPEKLVVQRPVIALYVTELASSEFSVTFHQDRVTSRPWPSTVQ
jgi:hypothetical protein